MNRSEHGSQRDAAPELDVVATLGLGRRSGRRRTAWWSVVALVAMASILAAAWWLLSADGAPRYRTAAVTRGALVVTVTATGTVQPIDQVDVGVEVSGTVANVEVDFNDRVTRGQVLARLDTSRLDQVVLQAEAALAVADARVVQAEASRREAQTEHTRLARIREISGGGLPSERELDAAAAALDRTRADAAAARATVGQARAALEAARTDLGKAVIRSPIDGLVLTRSVEPGQTVAATLQAPVLFTLAEDLRQMELLVDVDEADVGRVAEGQPAEFVVGAWPERLFPAHITQLRFGAQTVAGVVTYKAVLEVDNADLALRPGMTATAGITVERLDDALLVPDAALRFSPPEASTPASPSGGGSLFSRLMPRPHRAASRDPTADTTGARQQVWVSRNGVLEPIAITVGASDGVHSVVLDGALTPGLEVVVEAIEPSA